MKIVGLTGGIGSGKTTVANMFSELGVPVYIADIEAKKITDTSLEIREKLIDLLGVEAYANGVLNRKYVSDKIFNDSNLLESVNKIIHPKVAAHFMEWAATQKATYVLKEAAILFENGGYKACDLIILVTAPKAVRINRVMARDNATQTEIEQRMRNQWSDEKKRKLADIIIENEDIGITRQRVLSIHKSIR